MRLRRIVAATAASLGLVLAGALPAWAGHTHVKLLGNGRCVILAPDGGEADVQLPHADAFEPDRRHPLHVEVHLGEPGSRGGEDVILVAGSPEDLATCDGYVNG